MPLAAGEEWGNRWDFNTLVEASRHRFCPRHAAQCRRHHGDDEDCRHLRNALCRHRSALHRAHRDRRAGQQLGTFSGPLLMEYNYQGRTLPHLPVCLDFKDGKLYPNERPGLGVELDFKQLTQIAEFTEPVTARAQTYFRPDGSITNW